MDLRKKHLMELLDDKEVVEKISEVFGLSGRSGTVSDDENVGVHGGEYAELLRKNTELENRYRELESHFEQKDRECNALLAENQRLLCEKNSVSECLNNAELKLNDLSAEIKDVMRERSGMLQTFNELNAKYSEILKKYEAEKKKADYFGEMFSETDMFYQKYMTVGAEIRDSLKQIICADNLIKFTASCLDMKNLERLWDFMKVTMTQNTGESELKILSDMFEYFFGLCNSYNEYPEYELDDTKTGDYLDDDRHIRGRNSSARGKISEVLLRGYRSVTSKRYIRKSIVIAKED